MATFEVSITPLLWFEGMVSLINLTSYLLLHVDITLVGVLCGTVCMSEAVGVALVSHGNP